jgi:SpoVK/Ycf46/Vps4 family AAA+-type ATPase
MKADPKFYSVGHKEREIRELFRAARKSYPRWSHTSLLNLVWPKRPEKTHLNEMLRIAEEFRITDEP